MSRTTAGIMRINQELEKISGLDGIEADKVEELEKEVKTMVSDILENHSEASLFNYEGCESENTSHEPDMVDGITVCCGYDFGLDMDKANYCPICGKALVVKE